MDFKQNKLVMLSLVQSLVTTNSSWRNRQQTMKITSSFLVYYPYNFKAFIERTCVFGKGFFFNNEVLPLPCNSYELRFRNSHPTICDQPWFLWMGCNHVCMHISREQHMLFLTYFRSYLNSLSLLVTTLLSEKRENCKKNRGKWTRTYLTVPVSVMNHGSL